MCTQKPPYDYSDQLYTRYKEAFNTYIHERVRRQHALSTHTANSVISSYEILGSMALSRWISSGRMRGAAVMWRPS